MRSASRAFTNIRKIITSAMKFVWGNVISPILSLMQRAWNAFGDEILAVVKRVFGLMMIVVDTAVTNLFEIIDLFLDILAGDWQGAWNSIEAIVENTFTGMIKFLKGSVSLVGNAIDLIIQAIKFPFEQLYNWLFGNSLIKDLILDPVAWLKSTGLETIKSAFQGIVGGVKDVFGGIGGWFMDEISSLGSNLVDGIKDAVNDAIDWVNNRLPNTLSIPRITIGGQSIDLPSSTIEGVKIGGGSLNVPSTSVGGQSIDLPQLDTGGFIEEAGLAMLHAGEEVVPEAEVDRDRGGSGSRPVTADITVYAQDGTDAGQKIVDEMDRFL